MQLKQYLGDSVYADYDGYHVTLTTENGYGASNTIMLEPSVLEAVVRYEKWARETVAAKEADSPTNGGEPLP